MANDVQQLRDLARAYWAGEPVVCPKHPFVIMTGSFVQTTFADHLFLTCPRGKETITIPQRPKQMEFHRQQVEGFLENIERGDANLCYRCQSVLDIESSTNPKTGAAEYSFTCVRCFSYGTWTGQSAELAVVNS
ncbi:MAG: hypothetical protein QOC81_1425 [Thermoanaerobaculia bacterium]|jgi:hypothetical protein|nr:hypothetical protein [Thermoanaerobaculia bacterium]